MNDASLDNLEKPGCLETTLSIIGDKWTALILQELLHCPLTFSSLEKALANISPRTLSQRLDMLESSQIIEKKLYCEHPPRSKYSLTQKGLELQEVLGKMADWGAKYAPKPDARADLNEPTSGLL